MAVKTTGNVFSFEVGFDFIIFVYNFSFLFNDFQAIDQLNIKTKNWKDLLTDEPFVRADLITLQDPTNLTKFNIAKFHHVVKKIKVVDPGTA